MTEHHKFTEQQPPPLPERDDDAVLTRSAEELWIATYRRETQRARLTRYVETETVTKTIELRHEQVRVEYEPISAANELDHPTTGSTAGRDGWMVLYVRRGGRDHPTGSPRTRTTAHTVTEDRADDVSHFRGAGRV